MVSSIRFGKDFLQGAGQELAPYSYRSASMGSSREALAAG